MSMMIPNTVYSSFTTFLSKNQPVMSKCQETLFLMAFLSFGFAMPLKSLFISPDTVRYYASFIDSSAAISDLTIHFGTGTRDEELLRVPLAPLGDLSPQSLIRITIGMNPPAADGDPYIGITDGINSNQFQLIEHGSPNFNVNPCEVRNGALNGRSGPAGNPVAGGYTLLFDPSRRFGSCSTNNGFNSDAKFNSQLDTAKDLSLVVHRSEDVHEQYTFHFLLIEFV